MAESFQNWRSFFQFSYNPSVLQRIPTSRTNAVDRDRCWAHKWQKEGLLRTGNSIFHQLVLLGSSSLKHLGLFEFFCFTLTLTFRLFRSFGKESEKFGANRFNFSLWRKPKEISPRKRNGPELLEPWPMYFRDSRGQKTRSWMEFARGRRESQLVNKSNQCTFESGRRDKMNEGWFLIAGFTREVSPLAENRSGGCFGNKEASDDEEYHDSEGESHFGFGQSPEGLKFEFQVSSSLIESVLMDSSNVVRPNVSNSLELFQIWMKRWGKKSWRK